MSCGCCATGRKPELDELLPLTEPRSCGQVPCVAPSPLPSPGGGGGGPLGGLLGGGAPKLTPKTACCGCCAVCGALVVLLFVVSGLASLIPDQGSMVMAAPGQCEFARKSFDIETVLPAQAAALGMQPAMDIGTTANMPLDPNMGIDLTGIWWMDGNPAPEYLISWAGAEGSLPFPARVPTPNNLLGRWSWDTSFFAGIIMSYYAFTAAPEEPLVGNFLNSSYADLVPVTEALGDRFIFRKLTQDTWERPPEYILRRVVYGNGTAHPVFWPKLRDYYREVRPDGVMQAWATNSGCMRRCQVFLSCRLCSGFC